MSFPASFILMPFNLPPPKKNIFLLSSKHLQKQVFYWPLFCLSSPSPFPVAPPCSPLNPSASCRSVRLPVSVPIRFHLIHVTSINTQSSPDKSRPLSPPLCLSRVAVHHSLLPNDPPLLSLRTYKPGCTRAGVPLHLS